MPKRKSSTSQDKPAKSNLKPAGALPSTGDQDEEIIEETGEDPKEEKIEPKKKKGEKSTNEENTPVEIYLISL
jgi:hypothetical protein